MHCSLPALAGLLFTLGSASGKTITIDAGRGGKVGFKPHRVDADVGDVVEFRFDSEEHSVVQGDPSMGCYPVDTGGFYSGKQTSPATFQVTINNTDSILVYSSVGRECQEGMVASINANHIQDAGYRLTVATSIINSSPDDIFGGVLSKSNATGSNSDEESGASVMAISHAGAIAALNLAVVLVAW